MGILASAIRGVLRSRSQADRERDYLNQSVSRFDLERRQREIDEGRSRARRYPF